MKRRQFMLLMAAAPLVMTVTGRFRSAWSADAAGDKSLDRRMQGQIFTFADRGL